MSRTSTAIVLCVTAFAAAGQVEVDRSLRMVNSDPAERRIENLGRATGEDHLITLGGARTGTYLWSPAQVNGSSIALQPEPPLGSYDPGTRLRFLAPALPAAPVKVDVNGLGERSVVHGDGLPLQGAQVAAGTVLDIQYMDTAFVVQSRSAREFCPAGFLPANDRTCLQVDQQPAMNFFEASEHCRGLDAHLCTWPELLFACTMLTGQLNDMHTEWEWIDDTSDHTHTADQGARWTCRSQRSQGAVPSVTAPFRCCARLH